MTPLFDSSFAGTPKRGSVWVLSRVAGATLFLLLIWVVSIDAHRPLSVKQLKAIADSAVYGQVNAISSMLTGGPAGPASGGGGAGGGSASRLAAGVAATVTPYLMPARPAPGAAPVADSVFELTALDATRARGAMPLRTGMRLAGQIQTHTEKRVVALYLLEFARSDGQLGPYLTRSGIDCETRPVQPLPPILPVLPLKGHAPICGGVTNAGAFAVDSATIPELAEYIADEVGTTVVDRTGMLGRFNATLRWKTDPREAPSIFIALQQQFGLKLAVTTEALDVQVVDRVEGLSPKLR